ncbi:hypothetical protein HDU96_001066, partial [Phlyctochytrium bullatum]
MSSPPVDPERALAERQNDEITVELGQGGHETTETEVEPFHKVDDPENHHHEPERSGAAADEKRKSEKPTDPDDISPNVENTGPAIIDSIEPDSHDTSGTADEPLAQLPQEPTRSATPLSHDLDQPRSSIRKSKTKITPVSNDPMIVNVEDDIEQHIEEVISIARPTLTVEFDGKLKEMLEAIAQATSAAGGSSSEIRNRFAKILETKELNNIFNEPKLNPEHPEFDQLHSLKVIHAFFNAFGMDYPEMPVVFKDMNVLGDAVTDTRIPTVADPFKKILFPIIHTVEYWAGLRNTIFPRKLPNAKVILQPLTGLIQPGEVVLVLGRPGSGCSTLLKALTGRTASFKEVNGTLLHAGMGINEIKAHHRGEIHYTEEGDPHFPSLTVKQTLEFVLNCRFADAFVRERVLDVTLKLFGLTRCKDTVVGDHELRGVSGGEKKRVSLAEAFCLGGSFAGYDGCTKGLDAASALDFVKALRNISDIHGQSVVASCYQASDAMFDLFDKVIVLSEGYCIYFGPTSNAVQYFESLDPKMRKGAMDTKAQFVTSIATKLKHISASELHRRYSESEYGKAMQRLADEALEASVVKQARKNFRENIHRFRNVIGGVKESSTKGNGSMEFGAPRSSFVMSLPKQMALLVHRQWLITLGAPAAFII